MRRARACDGNACRQQQLRFIFTSSQELAEVGGKGTLRCGWMQPVRLLRVAYRGVRHCLFLA